MKKDVMFKRTCHVSSLMSIDEEFLCDHSDHNSNIYINLRIHDREKFSEFSR